MQAVLKRDLDCGDIYGGILKFNPNVFDAETEKVFESNQIKIRKYIKNLFPNRPLSAFPVLCRLLEIGVMWPWINQLLLDNKPKIIKGMLIAITLDNAGSVIYNLEKADAAKLNWEEFRIIKKSFYSK